MSESKEVSVVSSNTELDSIVSKDIKLNKEDIDPILIILPGIISSLILFAGVAGGITTGDLSNTVIAGGTTATMVAVSRMALLCEKFSKIDHTFFPKGDFTFTMKERRQAKKERVLANTIHIRDKVDVSITEWQDPKNAVPEQEATHTVTQYLRKTRKGYQVEQEITPNSESVWDLSADALVEVYGVQEKMNKMKEIRA